jgi:hypothetical protein
MVGPLRRLAGYAAIVTSATAALIIITVTSGLSLGSPSVATVVAVSTIPSGLLALYQQAATSCPGLDWSVLAAVGTVESSNGQHIGPSSAGAMGVLQLLPTTFAAYDHPVPADPAPTPIPPGNDPPSVWNPADNIWAAARYLCASGAATNPRAALVAYNCGNTGPACRTASAGYASTVLADAARLGSGGSLDSSPGAGVVASARSQLGVPYRWGGQEPGQAFDCSGLAQWAWAQVGVALARTAQAQYEAGSKVPPGQPLVPGDLVFFGHGDQITHVGIVTDPAGEMIDAPHAGATVRVDRFTPIPGNPFGPDEFVGAVRPA